jgi:hypothetical protein
MAENIPTQNAEEIDLGYLFEKIGDLFKSIVKAIVSVFNFYYKHKFVLIGLVLVAGLIGYFVEENSKSTYVNYLIVQPNFSSTEYVYKKIEVLNAKIQEGDSIFLKEIFQKDWDRISTIEIEAVNDVYDFVSRDEIYQETFQLLLEEKGDFEFIEDPINTRMYKQHTLDVLVKGKGENQKIVELLITYLNTNQFFENQKRVSLENYKDRIQTNERSLKQIDTIISNPSKETMANITSEGLSFNGVQDFNALIVRKEIVQKEILTLELQLNTEDEVVKLLNANYEIIYKEGLFQKNKMLLFPLVIGICYSLVFFFLFLRNKMLHYISH